ncbi:hypothetical protein B9Y02_10195 [Acinetobacter baumannii]|nr:hypothetical protein [Acinetobacter baumannii]KQD96127.1 hypothetical protein APD32_05610 [Acinetobacter baumannii]KQD98585.1 hypothetical protein APD31_12150 [Acinetobacter baumannii]OTL44613.1 hypothetical protein B9Y02_10195 [Acinetobacter baumannii]OTM29699.1 hypothetical protein B9X50_02215 [Acinetobacter baumannii]
METMTAQRFIIKSLFENRNNYPNAYTTTVKFRTWPITLDEVDEIVLEAFFSGMRCKVNISIDVKN